MVVWIGCSFTRHPYLIGRLIFDFVKALYWTLDLIGHFMVFDQELDLGSSPDVPSGYKVCDASAHACTFLQRRFEVRLDVEGVCFDER